MLVGPWRKGNWHLWAFWKCFYCIDGFPGKAEQMSVSQWWSGNSSEIAAALGFQNDLVVLFSKNCFLLDWGFLIIKLLLKRCFFLQLPAPQYPSLALVLHLFIWCIRKFTCLSIISICLLLLTEVSFGFGSHQFSTNDVFLCQDPCKATTLHCITFGHDVSGSPRLSQIFLLLEDFGSLK